MKVVELATMTDMKSMKGTPYFMAPEVILQTGHSLLQIFLMKPLAMVLM